MARRYRSIHERLPLWKAIAQGRPTRDCYLAQSGHWYGWRTIQRFNTADEAERACRDHAGGTLLPGGGRVVAEFERPRLMVHATAAIGDFMLILITSTLWSAAEWWGSGCWRWARPAGCLCDPAVVAPALTSCLAFVSGSGGRCRQQAAAGPGDPFRPPRSHIDKGSTGGKFGDVMIRPQRNA